MNEIAYHHDCSVVPDGPSGVSAVLNGMHATEDPWKHTFYDRAGRSVMVPRDDRTGKPKPWFDDGYAKALWDYRIGSMMLGEDGQTLYVRDVDQTGGNRLLESWHAIGSVEDEYHVKPGMTIGSFNLQLRVECAKLPRRVRHGVRFRNMAFLRVDGRVERIRPGHPLFDDPFEVFLDCDYTGAMVAQAGEWLKFVTEDEHSAQNLARMFATPLLEPYKRLSYILYGGGGNGKGILLGALRSSLPALSAAVNAQTLLGGRRGMGGFATDQETLKLIGALWAYDEDSDTIGLEQATLLKKISTGDTLVARRVRENAVSFRNRATFVIASNNPVVMQMTAALERRRAFVRMRDGRAAAEFQPLLDFVREHGVAPFMMASCVLWERHGDEPWADVAIGSPDDLTDAQQWLVDCIVADGYAVSADNPFREYGGAHMASVVKLGLRSAVRRIDGECVRVLVVGEERVFAVYRAAAEAALREALERDGDLEEVAEPPEPMDSDVEGTPTPDECGYPCTFGTVTDGKRSYDWARNRTLPAGQEPPRDAAAYAAVPAEGVVVIDMDIAKTADGTPDPERPTGWDILNREIGPYGSEQGLPYTYLTETPTGRRHGRRTVHAWYLIPDGLKGRLKNAVHEGGIPVDLRCEGKGYVVGAGSHIDGVGDYLLLDRPVAGPVMMTPRMVDWFRTHGYVEGEPATATTPASPAAAHGGKRLPSLSELMGEPIRIGTGRGGPDMTPVPAGSRNSTLHKWAYGRLVNHPDEEDRIHDDLLARGRASGLGDAELETIWGSILRRVGGAHAQA